MIVRKNARFLSSLREWTPSSLISPNDMYVIPNSFALRPNEMCVRN